MTTISAGSGADVASRWNANLSTPSAMQGAIQAQGRSWISSIDGGRKTRVDVEVSNMVIGGAHPWVLRSGQCGVGGADLLRVASGNILRVNREGRATASAELDRLFPTTGDYMIEVLASAENSDRVVACGNYAPPNTGVSR
ncbi:MAG TPA: hypothetical protein VE861_10750 [Gemmatimonadaceae bacterium]|nr:hypothetical protein [Gemmatimonadaceae bacterium]